MKTKTTYAFVFMLIFFCCSPCFVFASPLEINHSSIAKINSEEKIRKGLTSISPYSEEIEAFGKVLMGLAISCWSVFLFIVGLLINQMIKENQKSNRPILK